MPFRLTRWIRAWKNKAPSPLRSRSKLRNRSSHLAKSRLGLCLELLETREVPSATLPQVASYITHSNEAEVLYVVQDFNDRDGQPTLPFDSPDPDRMEAAWPDGAIWPREFQRPNHFIRKGHITSWDYYPEYAEGDMFSLKTLDLRVQWDGQYRQASSALACLALVYSFWIAYAALLDHVFHLVQNLQSV